MKLTTLATSLCLGFSSLIAGQLSLAQEAIRIPFAKGSYCSLYSGYFSGGRTFVINIQARQTLTIESTDAGNANPNLKYNIVPPVDYDILGQADTALRDEMYIEITGDYYIYAESQLDYDSVTFCVY